MGSKFGRDQTAVTFFYEIKEQKPNKAHRHKEDLTVGQYASTPMMHSKQTAVYPAEI